MSEGLVALLPLPPRRQIIIQQRYVRVPWKQAARGVQEAQWKPHLRHSGGRISDS